MVEDDITQLVVDAIIDTANSSLLSGGDVDGATHHVAGKELLDEYHTLGGYRTSEAKTTRDYRLPMHFIVHTVGPVWFGGKRNEEVKLIQSYVSSLLLAQEHDLHSIAFPCISIDVYRFLARAVIRITLESLKQTPPQCPAAEKTIFCCLSKTDAEYCRVLLATEQTIWNPPNTWNQIMNQKVKI